MAPRDWARTRRRDGVDARGRRRRRSRRPPRTRSPDRASARPRPRTTPAGTRGRSGAISTAFPSRGAAAARPCDSSSAAFRKAANAFCAAPSAFFTAPSRSASSSRSLPRAAAALDHVGQRRAVLALELREGVEALGDEREARGIGLELLEVAGGLEGDLGEASRSSSATFAARAAYEESISSSVKSAARAADAAGIAPSRRTPAPRRRGRSSCPRCSTFANLFLSEEISSSSPSFGPTPSISPIWKSRSSRRLTRSAPASARRARSRCRAASSRWRAATFAAVSSSPAKRSRSSRGAAGSRSSRASACP